MQSSIDETLAAARHRIDFADARVLMRHTLGCNPAQLIANGRAPLDAAQARDFDALVARRAAGEPVAYLVGSREFYGLAFKVTPAVLIPRPDTETLVDAALAHMQPSAVPAVLDLATGSGCVAIAIAIERPHAKVTASDIAPEAIRVAQENAAALGAANVVFRTGSWFEAVRGERFDLITANPPYVAPNDPHLLQGDVRFEPARALLGGTDGLDCIRRLVREAPAHLCADGTLAVEHGHDQGGACRSALADAGFTAILTHRDLAGHERVTEGRRA
jgi:release factor glutamine methyltransferase